MLPPVDQVPDAFVYLVRGKDQERICFARIPGTQLVAQVRPPPTHTRTCLYQHQASVNLDTARGLRAGLLQGSLLAAAAGGQGD